MIDLNVLTTERRDLIVSVKLMHLLMFAGLKHNGAEI